MILDLEERDRRYKLIRDKMSERGLDALIVIGHSRQDQKGFVRYITNFHNIMYGDLVIFAMKGEPKFLTPTPVQEHWARLLSWMKDIEVTMALGESLVRNLKNLGLSKGKLGLISPKIMPADVYLSMKEGLPEAIISDETTLLEKIRMVKSDKELQLIKVAAKLCDQSFEMAAKVLKPGVTERDVIGEVDKVLIANGAEYIFHLFSSDPENLYPFLPTNRIIRKGDVVLMNTELAGPEGYWMQSMRTCFIGMPRERVLKMYDLSQELRSLTQKELYPGKKASEIAQLLRKVIIDSGYETGVNFGHAQGLDIVERPQINPKEDTVFAPGMIVTVHPQLISRTDKATVLCGDPYLITDHGSEILTKFDPLDIKMLC